MRARITIGLVAAMAGCVATPAPASGSVTIVVDARAPEPYRAAQEAVVSALIAEDGRTIVRTRTLDRQQTGDEAAAWLASEPPSVLVTLGSTPFRTFADLPSRPPIVACMVLRPGDLRDRDGVTGVHLEFPAKVELEWMARLLPGRTRVGVLFSPSENQGRIAEADQAAKAAGLEIVDAPVADPRRLPEALAAVLETSDVLWAIPDSVAIRSETTQTMLLSALRRKVPVAGASKAWARAGAMWAIDRDYADIGKQCAEQAIAILHGASPASVVPSPPRRALLFLNLRSAALLGLPVPAKTVAAAEEIFR